MDVTLRPRSLIVAEPSTSRELWQDEGFTPYQIHRTTTQNVPLAFVKTTRWESEDDSLGYFARSTIVVEGQGNPWVPVEWNSEHSCWVEIRWTHNGPGDGHWEAYQIARPELGLDITPQDFEALHQAREVTQIADSTPSRVERATTPTTPPSVIRIFESPYHTRPSTPTDRITQLAEALNIQDNQMTNTAVTTEAITAQIGRIDPQTGHMFTLTMQPFTLLRLDQDAVRLGQRWGLFECC